MKAAWASVGDLAWERRFTFSVMVRPRSLKDSRMFGG